jgi:hypothetical protein
MNSRGGRPAGSWGPGRGGLQCPGASARWPDGRISFSGSLTDIGNWEGPANASIFFNITDGRKVAPAPSLPTNKTVDEIPFAPGMHELYDSRWDRRRESAYRCSPRGAVSGTHPMASRSSSARAQSLLPPSARRTLAWPISMAAPKDQAVWYGHHGVGRRHAGHGYRQLQHRFWLRVVCRRASCT